jgi:hypothetical protein
MACCSPANQNTSERKTTWQMTEAEAACGSSTSVHRRRDSRLRSRGQRGSRRTSTEVISKNRECPFCGLAPLATRRFRPSVGGRSFRQYPVRSDGVQHPARPTHRALYRSQVRRRVQGDVRFYGEKPRICEGLPELARDSLRATPRRAHPR